MKLEDSPSVLAGVGSRITQHLQNLGISCIYDLLFHLPSRYQDRTRVTPIKTLGETHQVLIEGEIRSLTITQGARPHLLCQINDGTGSIFLRFFHFNSLQKNQLAKIGAKLQCFGEVRRGYRHFGLEMIHPEYRWMESLGNSMLEKHLTPIYPSIQGLSQSVLRRLIQQALQIAQNLAENLELLPAEILAQYQLTELIPALEYVHQPPANADVKLLLDWQHSSQKRLAFEELVAHYLSLQTVRQRIQQQQAWALNNGLELREKLIALLPFHLTSAQQKVIAEIDHDLSQNYPMLRLLQGDVGSGKTIVAAMAILRAVAHGNQAALMAPTELLAEQHYQNFLVWFEPLAIQVGLLTGKQSAAHRQKILAQLAAGDLQVVVGTHALLQQTVQFKQLSLLIIDEQHRFGVNQRLALREKTADSCVPHQLIMSATPIPRTLAMTVYANLDLSVIDQLPPGRKPIVTALISNQRRDEVIDRVRYACASGKQVYWICTLIEESETLQCKAAESTAEMLREKLSELKIGMIHSRLPLEEKMACMQAFKQGKIDLLVATTVIEVGVDVPNASLMIIENPERLGLAQLHQLRGRVGRGEAQSFCLLLFQAPLSWLAQQRLQVLRDTSDGFVIAREDLRLRGPGEMMGTHQSGLWRLKIADLVRDQDLMSQAKAVAKNLITDYPAQSSALIARWIGHAEHYVNA